MRAAGEKNIGEQAAITPSGSVAIAENHGVFTVRDPDITSAGRGPVKTSFRSYPEEGFSSSQQIDQLVVSPVNDSHLFAVFIPQGRQNLPQQVYFIDGTGEKNKPFTKVHSFQHEYIIDFVAGQDSESSELVAVVARNSESQKTVLHIYDTKGQEVTNVDNVTTVISGEAGQFFYVDGLGKVYRLMKSSKTEGQPSTWQSELIVEQAGRTSNYNEGEPLFLTKALEGKVVVVTRKGHVFLVDPQKPEKNGSTGTHYQLPATSEAGKPLILCEAAATMDGRTGYAIVGEGESAHDRRYHLFQLYDLSLEPAPIEPVPAPQE
ncbi:MAG: hypothetical protein UR54_C0006G0014 [Candidatus Roizmanbacteria bacterium GW2011_GWA2_34_18]|uniref:Uncharacterized protein n=1 Tax=Candidatus Roizmanbacteria bacterium GW2011_GWA2_34_18 TaxID=1618477 RepID=A0A0G0BBA7_9BACT|nr:MAG: hypothetical protein UR54_C0006G0014 [Candidatus Roizmanbacteria bacterium GW2011_GWA2_34_18]